LHNSARIQYEHTDRRPGPVIRRGTLDDTDALLRICAESFPDSIRWQSLRSVGERWWNVVLRSRAAETWVCVVDDQVVSFSVIVVDGTEWVAEGKERRSSLMTCLCALSAGHKLILPKILKKVRLAKIVCTGRARTIHARAETGKAFWIDLIAVVPHMRGQGLAKKMLLFCESRALELQRRSVGLRVDPANKAACKLYERVGFVRGKHTVSGTVYTKVVGEVANE